MTSPDPDQTYREFKDLTNIPPAELEDWLETDESKSVGDSDSGESTGHRSGRRIVKLLRTKKADLTDDDLQHMRKVSGYIKRHTAQRPEGDIEHTPWRYSLMNWGHDPMKAE